MLHRVDYPENLPAQLFADRFVRLAAYDGAVAARMAQEERESNGSTTPAPGATHQAPSRDGSQTRHVPSDAATLATDPGLGGLVEVRKG